MDNHSNVPDKGPVWWKSMRYRLAMVGFFGITNICLQRYNLSMAIVCMINHTAVDSMQHKYDLLFLNQSHVAFHSAITSQNLTAIDNYTSTTDEVWESHSCVSSGARGKEKKEDGDFVWSKETQGLLLGALFWGYVSTQVVFGYGVKRFGIRWTTGSGMVIMSLLTLSSHGAAVLSPWALFVVRVLIGLCNAVCLTGIFFLLTLWAPPEEKGRLTTVVFAGEFFSNVIVFPLSALLCSYGFAGGWPSIFYVTGSCSLLWCATWFWWVYDSPLKHPSIHPKERDYIMSSLKTSSKKSSSKPFPWCKIMTSLPVYAVISAHVSNNWGYYLLLTNLPLYMREVLHFDIKSNGLFSMLPNITMWVMISISGGVADYFVRRFGLHFTRKAATMAGLVIPSGLLIAIGYLDCESIPLIMFLLCLAVGLMVLNMVGMWLNFFDIAGEHAGQLMTLSNTLANTTGIISPYVVAEFTKDNTREQWQDVFFLTAGIMCVGSLIFFIFGQVTTQTWAETEITDNEESEKLQSVL